MDLQEQLMSGTSSPGPAPDTLELAALLCSRVCHDLISPVGAIVNGLEVLDDNPKPEDREFALDLIRKSAKTASARLQFCRLAFGAAGSSGAQIDLGDAQTMARGHLEDGKTTIVWNLPRLLLPKNKVKLLLNMLVIAQQTIPRGGVLTVDAVGEGDAMGFRVAASGLNARMPQKHAAFGAVLRTESSACARRRSGGRDGFLTLSRALLEKVAGANIWLTSGLYRAAGFNEGRLISLLSPFFSNYSTNIKRFA